MVYDLTNEDSFQNLNFWIKDLKEHAPEKLVQVLVGNKCDLVGFNQTIASLGTERQISYDDAIEFAQRSMMHYFEVSAKSGANINSVFEKIA